MGQRHLGKTFHGDALGGDVLDVLHVYQIGAVRAQKARVICQLPCQLVHAAAALDDGAVQQMEYQRAPLHLAVFQTVQCNAGHAAFAAQDQAVLGALAALGQHSIGKAEKAVLPDGLELVVVCAYHIGLYGKFRRGSDKDDLHRRVVLADLPGGIDAVDAGHEHIQKQHVKAHPGLDICQKLHGFCIGKQLQLHTPQGTVLLQKILHLMQQGGIVITESDPGHSKEILSEQKSTL